VLFFTPGHQTGASVYFPRSKYQAYIMEDCSRDSSGGIALGHGLNERRSRVRFPAGAGNFSLPHRVQTGSGANQPSYPVGTSGSFPGGKAVGA
jgi:hypothetical protein